MYDTYEIVIIIIYNSVLPIILFINNNIDNSFLSSL